MKVDIFNTDRKYDVIYADPPWAYRTYSKKGQGRSAESKKNIQDLEIALLQKKTTLQFIQELVEEIVIVDMVKKNYTKRVLTTLIFYDILCI